jgi:hypothetical protein
MISSHQLIYYNIDQCKPRHGSSDNVRTLYNFMRGIILYIKATVVVSVSLCGQCLEDSSSHCPFPVELPQM